MKSISVLIPAWNEELAIEKTIRGIPRDKIAEAGYVIQVLVIDGGSTDTTVERAKKAGAEVCIDLRRGYGRAYKTGFAAANGEIIATVDADGTYPVQDIPKFVRMLEEEDLDFITTDRFTLMEKGTMSFRNKLGNWILAVETRLLFGLALKDPESGMWIFRRRILNALKLNNDNNTFSHEIKLEACYFAKSRWKEVPIRYKAREGGESRLSNGWNGWKAGLACLLHIAEKRIAR